MNLAELFIRRPIMTGLVTASILLFGVLAYQLLSVNDLPNVDYPTIEVSASLPGANPETMASAVAIPLERQFSTIAGLDSMSSVNTQGSTAITLQFDLSRNIDAAAQDVQAAISGAAGQLPVDMPAPPSYAKVNPADQPIIYMSVSSPTLPLSTVHRVRRHASWPSAFPWSREWRRFKFLESRSTLYASSLIPRRWLLAASALMK